MKKRQTLKPPARAQRNIPGRQSGGWRILWLILPVISLCVADQRLGSQQPTGATQQPPITVHVKVVNALVTVRDKKGAIVSNLTKEDFALEEDGRPQAIRYFSNETDLPLTLGLLVDTSLSVRRVLGEERSASSTFLDQVLRVDKDQAFLIHFDREVELLQDLTSSRQKLQAALDLLQMPQRSEENRGDSPDSGSQRYPDGGGGGNRGGGGRGGGARGGGTLLYDAVYLGSKDVMAKQTGRKALIVLSDGVDRGSKKTLASAIEAAQRADTLVYSILFQAEEQTGGYGRGGMGGMGGGMGGRGGGMGGGMGGRHGGGYPRYPQESRPDGKKILERLSKETGGRFFEVSKKHPIDATYDQIQDELRHQYSLGYSPNPLHDEAGYHKITVTVPKKDVIVQARDGYYSGQ